MTARVCACGAWPLLPFPATVAFRKEGQVIHGAFWCLDNEEGMEAIRLAAFAAGQRAAYLAEFTRVDEALWNLALEWDYQMRSGGDDEAQRILSAAVAESGAWHRLRLLAMEGA